MMQTSLHYYCTKKKSISYYVVLRTIFNIRAIKMKTSFNSPSIIKLSLIIIVLINQIMFTASSFPQDNDPYGWMLIKGEDGEWKVAASTRLTRRSLKADPPLAIFRPPSPEAAQSPHMFYPNY
ncbi:hypothetical protein RND81_02G019800 [Saponaria officinalis]|uniref:Uncharacterized protein n=1 Tax=Saponaria officinalis TaxID=3572 RepID=A0AAW1MSU9_SAPOF